MVNPVGRGLAGDADDSTPGWEERVKARAAKKSEEIIRRKKKRAGMLYIDVDPEFVLLVTHAARERGMPRAAYIRRAVAAFIAHDLDVPVEEVLEFCPAVAPHGQPLTKDSGLRDGGRSRDDGTGYGSWKVV
jgi:hypothetical protein